MANYIRKFETTADYEAATLQKPAVSLIETTGGIIYNSFKMLGNVRVTYLVEDPSVEIKLYAGGGSGSESGSESGSGGGAASLAKMWIDGDEVMQVATYRFETSGKHYVDFLLEDGEGNKNIPEEFFNDNSAIVKVEVGASITDIGTGAFMNSDNIEMMVLFPTVPTSIGSEVTFTGTYNIYVPSASVSAYKTDFGYYSQELADRVVAM